MKTVRRLVYRDILSSVAFVAVAFLSLFFFIDFVEELKRVTEGRNRLMSVVQTVIMMIPGHLYELMPICVLIGSIYALSRMAQTSEFTILRTGGLGPGRALGLLAVLGVAFAVLTFTVGDYLAPWSEREVARLRAKASGTTALGQAGAWLKERRMTPDGELQVSVNVSAVGKTGELVGIRIFEFDARNQLHRRIDAQSGRVEDRGVWELKGIRLNRWPGTSDSAMEVATLEVMSWPSSLEPGVVAAAVLPLQTMSTMELRRYSAHLSHQEQASQAHEFQFWRRALYPLACMVMMALALPFAYLQARSGGISLKVFGGILLGISFVLLSNLSGHLAILQDWSAWMAAAVPGLVYLILSLGAFWWLVRFR